MVILWCFHGDLIGFNGNSWDPMGINGDLKGKS
jgi:hypothetical protein